MAIVLLVSGVPAWAAGPAIAGYGPYVLGQSYKLDELPAGLERGPEQDVNGYKLQTITGEDTLTFGGETFQAGLTLYLYQGVLLCVTVDVDLDVTADQTAVRHFLRDLREQTLGRYQGDRVLANSYSGRGGFHRRQRTTDWMGRLLISDDDGQGSELHGNLVGLFWAQDGIELDYVTAAASRQVFQDDLTSAGDSASKL